MPPKKGTSKKSASKVVASADAKIFNNGEKVGEESSDAKILANGNSLKNGEDTKEYIKSKPNKRGSARSKNVPLDLDMEASSSMPIPKGRGKGKSNENEVIVNETDTTEPRSEELDEIKSKPKGRGGGKKVEPKAKKDSKGKDKKEAVSTEGAQEEQGNKGEETKFADKDTKAVSGRKKKTEDVSKIEEQIEVNQEVEEEIEEKVSKRSSRNSNKIEIVADIEPQKKKDRISKKEKLIQKNDVEMTVVDIDKVQSDVKEKKLTKRGRNTAKAVIALEDAPDISGNTEQVIPKKRSRKAPSIEKEILKEKPKRGRAKKGDKIEADILEKNEVLEKEAENAPNGQVELKEKTEIIEETLSSNEEAAKDTETAPSASTKTKGGRKRAAPSTNNNNNNKTSKRTGEDGKKLDDGDNNTAMEDEIDGSKPSKTKRNKSDSVPLNATTTKYNAADFDLVPPTDGETGKDPRFNLKISSWNVAGLRSWLKKEGLKFLDYEQPDIFCMQETKCTNDQLPEEIVRLPGYHPYWLCMPGGYAGVAIYSKIMPINVEYGIGNKEFDDCGRIITAEYEKFFLINVYVPNSGRKLVNLESRMIWEKLFQQFVKSLDARKPVVICGDMNVSHQEHDLANPKTNTRNAGFTKEERDKMTELLALGYVDTFRHLYPERKGAYTFWTYMGNARSRNVGWRLDYFIVSERFIKRVVDNCMRSQCMGSDHCPITLFLKL